MLKADPANPELLLLLAKGFGGYAFAFADLEAALRDLLN